MTVRPRPAASVRTGTDRRRLLGMAGFVVLLHVTGWGILAGAHGFGAGLGVTAYVLGLRHAFDVDHIVAIDNTTRKLLSDGRRPLSVGFWFSLGHSTVVLVLCLALGLGARALTGGVTDGSSALHRATGLWGSLVSALFLVLIGVLNARSFAGIRRMAKDLREGRWDEAELEAHLRARGLLARILGVATKAVRKEWHMHPVGLLFGLGFDTATEVALLVLSSSAAASDVPWYELLALPVLFAAGMCALDTADGVMMTAAYEWALVSPARRIRYNLVITGISVATAFLVGGLGLAGLAGDALGVTSGPLAWVQDIGFVYAGYGVVALFLVVWIVGMLVRQRRPPAGAATARIPAATTAVRPILRTSLLMVLLRVRRIFRGRAEDGS